jgi:hypothetical protein
LCHSHAEMALIPHTELLGGKSRNSPLVMPFVVGTAGTPE